MYVIYNTIFYKLLVFQHPNSTSNNGTFQRAPSTETLLLVHIHRVSAVVVHSVHSPSVQRDNLTKCGEDIGLSIFFVGLSPVF